MVAVVLAGLGAQLIRPLAPDLGPVPDPSAWFTPVLLERIAAYRTPLRWVALAGTVIDVAVPLAVAFLPAGRRLVDAVVGRVGPGRPVRAAALVVAAIVALTAVARAPLGLWAHRHARAFGLSTQSAAGWIGDWAIARGVELAVAVVLTLGGYALLRRWPASWHLIAAPAGVLVIAAAVLLSPVLVEPLRFDLHPLEQGPLRDELEAVLAVDDRARSPLLVADASRRTIAQNAYVSGLWGTRRVVLYDTLLERDPAEVAQVLAHELAHERNRDLLRGVLAGGAGWVLTCGVLAATVHRRVARGRQATAHDPRGAAALVAVVVVLAVLSAPVTAWSSRRAEAAADLGALELTGDPATFCAMQRGLVERNLSDPAPPTWQRLWSWSHPPGASRLALAQRWSREVSSACG